MRTFIVDAFTTVPYSGNPAGVCILNTELSEKLMQSIASEINLSETAFLLKQESVYLLRWFTPKVEVALCGHATLASAHILFETGLVEKEEQIRFETKSGVLKANLTREMVELDFPQLFVQDCESNEIIEKAFGIDPIYIGRDEKRYLIEINNVDQLKQISPDFQLLRQSDRGGFIITARAGNGYDFHSRFFAPGVGINEDPVTGSAHCYLAPYWSDKLKKNEMRAFQSSQRTGIIECELAGKDRVLLRGNAVTMNEMKRDWKITIEG